MLWGELAYRVTATVTQAHSVVCSDMLADGSPKDGVICRLHWHLEERLPDQDLAQGLLEIVQSVVLVGLAGVVTGCLAALVASRTRCQWCWRCWCVHLVNQMLAVLVSRQRLV